MNLASYIKELDRRIDEAEGEKKFWEEMSKDGRNFSRSDLVQVWTAVIATYEEIRKDLEELGKESCEHKRAHVYVDANTKMLVFLAEDDSGCLLAEGRKQFSNANSYIAELEAVSFAVLNYEGNDFEIIGDNEAVIKQINGSYHVTTDEGRDLILEIRKRARGRNITFTWVKREDNHAGKLLK